MYTILLSGGSGKRLWPLSSAARSKQYIPFFKSEEDSVTLSMVQRIWSQLQKNGLAEHCILCAGHLQIENLQAQLGDVPLAVEPAAKDTFPAISLSCAYLKDKMNASLDDTVCILPVDPYTDHTYFQTLLHMPSVLSASNADVVLMGIQPKFPSAHHGYILTEPLSGPFMYARQFIEKPDMAKAEQLLRQGALWNAGVFCLKIGTVLDKLSKMNLPTHYEQIYADYDTFPAISFDYAFVENCSKIAVVPFTGAWKDIGTWQAISQTLGEIRLGDCTVHPSCRHIFTLNETNIPVVLAGVSNLIAVASYDGILITHSQNDYGLKEIVNRLPARPTLQEKRWGSSVVLDYSEENGVGCLLRKIHVAANQNTGKQTAKTDTSVSVLKGTGELILQNKTHTLGFGDTFFLPVGSEYTLQAKQDLWLTFSQQGSLPLILS